MNTYEAMFLFDPAFGANWEAVEAAINRLMERAEAEIIVVKRLEERRLAYDVKGRRRGLYVVVYFRARGDKLPGMERDIRISENILRVLILRADDLPEEKMHQTVLSGSSHDRRRRGEDTGRPSGSRGGPSGESRSSEEVGRPRPEPVPVGSGSEEEPAGDSTDEG